MSFFPAINQSKRKHLWEIHFSKIFIWIAKLDAITWTIFYSRIDWLGHTSDQLFYLHYWTFNDILLGSNKKNVVEFENLETLEMHVLEMMVHVCSWRKTWNFLKRIKPFQTSCFFIQFDGTTFSQKYFFFSLDKKTIKNFSKRCRQNGAFCQWDWSFF